MENMEQMIAIGYDMDAGGYEPDDRGAGGFEVGDSDFREYTGLRCTDYDYLRFHPDDYSDREPETRIEDEEILIPVAHGLLQGSDHDCWQCEGSGEVGGRRIDVDLDVTGESCDRCEGAGYVYAVGGRWIAYECFRHFEVGDIIVGALADTWHQIHDLELLLNAMDLDFARLVPDDTPDREWAQRKIDWCVGAISVINAACPDGVEIVCDEDGDYVVVES